MIWRVTDRLTRALTGSFVLAMALMSMAGGALALRNAQVKPHQATGVVAASGPGASRHSQKIPGATKYVWTFVVNLRTAFDGKAAKGARVRIRLP